MATFKFKPRGAAKEAVKDKSRSRNGTKQDGNKSADEAKSGGS